MKRLGIILDIVGIGILILYFLIFCGGCLLPPAFPIAGIVISLIGFSLTLTSKIRRGKNNAKV